MQLCETTICQIQESVNVIHIHPNLNQTYDTSTNLCIYLHKDKHNSPLATISSERYKDSACIC